VLHDRCAGSHRLRRSSTRSADNTSVTNSGADYESFGPRRLEDLEQARTLAQRSLVDWDARYRHCGGTGWHRCRVLNISIHGAGLLLDEDTAEPLTAIILELRTLGQTYGIALTGEVRHSSVTDGRRRIGIEFVDVPLSDRHALREIVARRCELKEQPPRP
jgi:PilZ domain